MILRFGGETFKRHQIVVEAPSGKGPQIAAALWQEPDPSVMALYTNTASMKGWLATAIRLRDVQGLPGDLARGLFEEIVNFKLEGVMKQLQAITRGAERRERETERERENERERERETSCVVRNSERERTTYLLYLFQQFGFGGLHPPQSLTSADLPPPTSSTSFPSCSRGVLAMSVATMVFWRFNALWFVFARQLLLLSLSRSHSL